MALRPMPGEFGRVPAPRARAPRRNKQKLPKTVLPWWVYEMKPGDIFEMGGRRFTAGDVPIYDYIVAVTELRGMTAGLVALGCACGVPRPSDENYAGFIRFRDDFVKEMERRGIVDDRPKK